MKVSRLELTDFRNYENEKIEFGDGVNVICGDNAQGKTNILEAIYFFSLGKSNRARKDAEMIRHNAELAKIAMTFCDSQRENILEAEIYRDRRKKISANEILIKKNSELVRRFNAVYFGPEYMGLVKEGPSVRRKNIDILISQIKSGYIGLLAELRKIVDSKNALLRMEKPNITMLDIMDEKLAKISTNIILCRYIYINRIASYAGEIQSEISDGKEELGMQYESCIGDVSCMDASAVENALKEKLKDNRAREMRLCESVIGPHREDITFLINGNEAKLYASQGQQKTIVMSKKLAEVRLMTDETGETPVLLLDDIMSELDKKRREYVLEHISDMQILITCTDLDGMTLPDDVCEFKVTSGHTERM